MTLISPGDQERLRQEFTAMTRDVRLLFFTQTFGCETCFDARRILDELPALSSRISIEEVNLVLDGDRAAKYGIDRAPGVVPVFVDSEGVEHDSRIRFLGAPAGYEFLSLVQAVLLVGGRPSNLTEVTQRKVAGVGRPMSMQVFTTPTCPHCPRAVILAHEMAFANPQITASAVDASEFPDLARRFHVNGVPKTVVDDNTEIMGALPEDAFVDEALKGVAQDDA